ncbi:MFS transporter [Singulisphaera sp. PoT]|uniref:MFS transporter n=1 Tax=Singulisphaera sp. PoT TaxID=3411797 RepID=UPI003BF55073
MDHSNTTSTAEITPGRQRAILLTLAAVQFTSIVDFMVVMPLGSQLMDKLNINPDKFGNIVSAYTISAGIAGFFAASFIDRFGRRASFLSLFSGFLVGTLLCGLANSYVTLLAARVLTGAFGGVLGGMAMAIIGDVFPPQRHASATAALMSAFAVASVLGVPFGLFIGTKFGWQWPFLVLAGCGVLVLLAAMYTMPPLRQHLDPSKPAASPIRQLQETLSDPNHVRAFTLIITLMFGTFAVVPYIAAYLVANVNVKEDQLPWIYVTGGALTLVAAPVIGRLADRFGKLTVYRCVAPVSALLMFLVTLLPPVPLVVAVAIVGLLMMSNAGRMIGAMAMVMASVDPRRRGTFMSANSSVQHLASGLGAYVGGQIIVKLSSGRWMNYPWVGVIGALATLFSLYLAGRLRTFSAPSAPNSTVPGEMEEATEAVVAAESF